MRRTSFRICALLGLGLLAATPLSSAQDFTQNPKSPAPGDLPGKQLIVWSETQKPTPVPATSPAPDAVRQEPSQTARRPQNLSGIILARGSDVFLASADHPAFLIDNKERVSEFAGKQVRVRGSIDGQTSIVHVLSIELLK